jgi:hypothetical protein
MDQFHNKCPVVVLTVVGIKPATFGLYIETDIEATMLATTG